METEIKQTPAAVAGAPPAAAQPHTYSRGQILAVMSSVLLGILLAALDQTIVGPALPRIIADLQGFDRYAWVVTIYLLTSTITVPIVGKLSDMYGRKWLYLSGIVVFLLGWALSGLSEDMNQLIIFRGLQGVGGGLLFALAFTIIADLIPPADRGRWQGLFGSVFGLASVIGPTIGGYLTDNLSWHWVFFVNLPVGVIAIVVLLITFPSERSRQVKLHNIDWLGAGALIAGLVPLLIALSFGGSEGWAWDSPQILGMLVAAVVFLVLFAFIERRAKEPIIPLDLFKNNTFSLSTFIVFVTGVGMFGAILYIPLYIQAIQGGNATESGNSVMPMTFAMIVSSVLTGQIVSRTGKYKVIAIMGTALVTAGMFLLWTMDMNTDRLVTIAYMIVLGLGLGVAMPLYTLIVQNDFPIQRVGVVTSSLQFFRSIGSTVGVAVLGTVVNSQFHQRIGPELRNALSQAPLSPGSAGGLSGGLPSGGLPGGPSGGGASMVDQLVQGLSNVNPQALLSPEGATQMKAQLITMGVPQQFADTITQAVFTALKPALFGGINEAFLIGALLLATTLVAVVFLREIPLRKSNMGAMRSMGEGGEAGAMEEEAIMAGKELAVEGVPATTLPARDNRRLMTGRD
jgi:EmrB/QacA subfamily drug resistance transporter